MGKVSCSGEPMRPRVPSWQVLPSCLVWLQPNIAVPCVCRRFASVNDNLFESVSAPVSKLPTPTHACATLSQRFHHDDQGSAHCCALPCPQVPSADAPVEEITAFLKRLGAKPGSGDGPFAGKPPFWEKPGFLLWCASVEDQAAEEARFAAASQTYADVKRSYDMSRETISRTDYEVGGCLTRLEAGTQYRGTGLRPAGKATHGG